MTLSFWSSYFHSQVLGLQACVTALSVCAPGAWTLGYVDGRQVLYQLNSISSPPLVQTVSTCIYSKGWGITWASGVQVGSNRVSTGAGAAAWTRCSLFGTSCPYLALPNLANSSSHRLVLHANSLAKITSRPKQQTAFIPQAEEAKTETSIMQAFSPSLCLLNSQPTQQPLLLLGRPGQLVNKKLMEFIPQYKYKEQWLDSDKIPDF